MSNNERVKANVSQDIIQSAAEKGVEMILDQHPKRSWLHEPARRALALECLRSKPNVNLSHFARVLNFNRRGVGDLVSRYTGYTWDGGGREILTEILCALERGVEATTSDVSQGSLAHEPEISHLTPGLPALSPLTEEGVVRAAKDAIRRWEGRQRRDTSVWFTHEGTRKKAVTVLESSPSVSIKDFAEQIGFKKKPLIDSVHTLTARRWNEGGREIVHAILKMLESSTGEKE